MSVAILTELLVLLRAYRPWYRGKEGLEALLRAEKPCCDEVLPLTGRLRPWVLFWSFAGPAAAVGTSRSLGKSQEELGSSVGRFRNLLLLKLHVCHLHSHVALLFAVSASSSWYLESSWCEGRFRGTLGNSL